MTDGPAISHGAFPVPAGDQPHPRILAPRRADHAGGRRTAGVAGAVSGAVGGADLGRREAPTKDLAGVRVDAPDIRAPAPGSG